MFKSFNKFHRRFVTLAVSFFLLTTSAALASETGIDWNRAWHGRLMVLAWAFLFPVGIFAARFFKVLPWQNWPKEVDNLTWWNIHRITQYAGLAIVAIAIWLIWSAPADATRSLSFHRWGGWLLVSLAIVQLLGGLLRGTKGGPTDLAKDGSHSGDHYDMTPRRKLFESVHKSVGYASLLISILVVFTGLYAALAPLWMWLAIALWWTFMIILWIVLTRKIDRINTYQAIWGPNEQHPGNKTVDFK